MSKNRKVKKGVIITQIIGMLLFTWLLILVLVGTIPPKSTKDIIISGIFTIEYILLLLQEINVIKEAAGYKVKHTPVYVWLFLFIILLTGLGIFTSLLIKNITIKSNGINTEAIIYNIDKKVEYKEKYDENNNKYEEKDEKCTYYISYTVGNKEYKNRIENTTCNRFKKGKVKICYNKSNPSEFIYSDDWFAIVGIVACGVALILMIYVTIRDLKPEKNKKNKKKSLISFE